MIKKMIALLLCLFMVAALAGCGSQIDKYEEPQTDAEPTAEAEEAADGDAEDAEEAEGAEAEDEDAEDAEQTPDPGLGYAAFAPDEVVATFNGQDVTWQEYYYWLSYYADYAQYMAALSGTSMSGWDEHELDPEYTNAEAIYLSAQDSVFQYHAAETLAQELDVTLTEEDEAEVLEIFEMSADGYYGDGDGECTEEEAAAYEEYLEEQFISRELFDYMSRVGILAEKSFAELYGEDAEKYSDEDTLAFAEDAELLAAKHILLLTVDMATGEALSDEEIEEKTALVEQLHEELAALEGDPEALAARFDELMNEYSEDSGLEANPNGYLFAPGVMVTEFTDTTAALEEYGLSEPVESSYGYHIIMRIPIDPDGTALFADGSDYPLRYAAANEAFYAMMDQAMLDAEVVWNGDFETPDMTAIFGALA